MDLPFLLRPREPERRLRRPLERHPEQQGRGRAVAQRHRRQRLRRSQDRLAAGHRQGRLQDRRYRPLRSQHREFLLPDRRAQGRQVEAFTSVLAPPVFTNFWTQCAQQGWRPKVITPGKSVEFPPIIKTLGPLAKNFASRSGGRPTIPSFGITGQILGGARRRLHKRKTGKQWFMVLGFKHALFEVGLDSLKRAQSLQPEAIRTPSRPRATSPSSARCNGRRDRCPVSAPRRSSAANGRPAPMVRWS